MKTTEFTMPEITISYKDNVKASERVKILSSETSYSYLKPFYSECMEHHEESYVMFLNRANKALGVSFISKGGMAETIMDVKIILQTALKVHASGIILSHNHPSGNLRPSEPDKQITSKIKEACKVLDLHLLDHIILTEESYYSFTDGGAFISPFFTLSLPNTKSLMAFVSILLNKRKIFPKTDWNIVKGISVPVTVQIIF